MLYYVTQFAREFMFKIQMVLYENIHKGVWNMGQVNLASQDWILDHQSKYILVTGMQRKYLLMVFQTNVLEKTW